MAMITIILRTTAIMIIIDMLTSYYGTTMITAEWNTLAFMIGIMLTTFAFAAMIADAAADTTTIMISINLMITTLLSTAMITINRRANTSMILGNMLTL